MKSKFHFMMFMATAVNFCLAQGSEINLPKQREEVVQAGNSLLERGATVQTLDLGSMVDPFNGRPIITPKVEAEQPVVAAPVVVVEVSLEALAREIRASGTVMRGDQRQLLVGARRYKVGDRVPVVLDGGTHEVTITSITSTSFTISQGEASHTRAIK